ncbi:hypothetical protein ACLQ24_07390 [Micromonospora sp. DT4]|uniref:hypothetical protein n=1 Tax=Micromonospora sp. DT4 TaxID=3393438 RepID=UPI003CE7EEFF
MLPEVLSAPPVAGLHLVHLDAGPIGSPVVDVLLAQPVDVAARAIIVPPMSVGAGLAVVGALARADTVRLPVRLPGQALAGEDLASLDPERVVPLGVQGRSADLANADYVLVLPERHLIAEYPASPIGLGVTQTAAGTEMPWAVRWIGKRAEVGLPQPTVNARFGHLSGVVGLATPVGAILPVDGGVIGLWRELAGLTPGQAMLVQVRSGEEGSTASLVAIRSSDGIALLHDTSSGVRAATLPRHPTALGIAPAIVPLEAMANTGVAISVVHRRAVSVLAENGSTREIALGTPPTQAAIMDRLSQVNPWWSLGKIFRSNCVLAAQGVEMMLAERGALRVQVPPSEPMRLTDLVNFANDAGRGVAIPEGGFGFVHTTVGAVRRALDTAAVWDERGFVAVPGPSGSPRHVVNAVRLEHGPALLDGQVGHAVTIEDDTPVWFLPLTEGIRVDGPAVAAADLGAEQAGAAGIEVETETALEPPAGLTEDQIWGLGVLAESPNAKIVIDRREGDWIFEAVTFPARMSQREAIGRVSVDAAIADVRQAIDALAGGAGKSLEEALRSTAFTVTAAGEGVTVLDTDQFPDSGFFYTQYTVGVPLVQLFWLMLEETSRFPTEELTESEVRSQLHHTSALGFAATVVREYDGIERDLSKYETLEELAYGSDMNSTSLAGFIALAYTQVAAAISGEAFENLPKNNTMIASRTALAAVRRGLPGDTRLWVESRADDLAYRIVADYVSRMVDGTAGQVGGSPARVRWFLDSSLEMTDGSGTYRLREYLASIFAVGAPLLDQNQVLEVRTHMLTLDDGHGQLEAMPLVVLELRHHHPFYPTLDEVEAEFRTLAGRLGERMDQLLDRIESRAGGAPTKGRYRGVEPVVVPVLAITDAADLSKVLDSVTGPVGTVSVSDPLIDPASCVMLLSEAMGHLFPQRWLRDVKGGELAGLRHVLPQAVRTVDDSVLDRRQRSRLVGGADLVSFTSWKQLEARLEQAGTGAGSSTALILVQRSSHVGHAIGAHRFANGDVVYFDLQRERGKRVLAGRPALSPTRASAVILNESGREVPVAREGVPSLIEALIDPAADHRFGAVGFEAETRAKLNVTDPGIYVLAWSKHLSVHLDHDADGNSIIELVTKPFNLLNGEDGHSDRSAVVNAFANEFERLTRIEPGVTIAEHFSEERGFATEGAADFRVVSPHRPDETYVQFTTGVPLAGIYGLMEFAERRGESRLGGIPAELSRRARAFSDEVVKLYVGHDNLLDWQRDVETMALRGFMASVTAQVLAPVALQSYKTSVLTVHKNMLLVASRAAPAVMRRSLPPKVQDFLEENVALVSAMLAERMMEYPFVRRWYFDGGADSAVMDMLNEGIDNALLPEEPGSETRNQYELISMRTYFDELDAAPEGGLALVPQELRMFGKRRIGPNELARCLELVEAESKRLNETARAILHQPFIEDRDEPWKVDFEPGQSDLSPLQVRRVAALAYQIAKATARDLASGRSTRNITRLIVNDAGDPDERQARIANVMTALREELPARLDGFGVAYNAISFRAKIVDGDWLRHLATGNPTLFHEHIDTVSIQIVRVLDDDRGLEPAGLTLDRGEGEQWSSDGSPR